MMNRPARALLWMLLACCWAGGGVRAAEPAGWLRVGSWAEWQVSFAPLSPDTAGVVGGGSKDALRQVVLTLRILEKRDGKFRLGLGLNGLAEREVWTESASVDIEALLGQTPLPGGFLTPEKKTGTMELPSGTIPVEITLWGGDNSGQHEAVERWTSDRVPTGLAYLKCRSLELKLLRYGTLDRGGPAPTGESSAAPVAADTASAVIPPAQTKPIPQTTKETP